MSVQRKISTHIKKYLLQECELVLNTQLLGFLPCCVVAAGSYTHLKYAHHAVRAAALSS